MPVTFIQLKEMSSKDRNISLHLVMKKPEQFLDCLNSCADNSQKSELLGWLFQSLEDGFWFFENEQRIQLISEIIKNNLEVIFFIFDFCKNDPGKQRQLINWVMEAYTPEVETLFTNFIAKANNSRRLIFGDNPVWFFTKYGNTVSPKVLCAAIIYVATRYPYDFQTCWNAAAGFSFVTVGDVVLRYTASLIEAIGPDKSFVQLSGQDQKLLVGFFDGRDIQEQYQNYVTAEQLIRLLSAPKVLQNIVDVIANNIRMRDLVVAWACAPENRCDFLIKLMRHYDTWLKAVLISAQTSHEVLKIIASDRDLLEKTFALLMPAPTWESRQARMASLASIAGCVDLSDAILADSTGRENVLLQWAKESDVWFGKVVLRSHQTPAGLLDAVANDKELYDRAITAVTHPKSNEVGLTFSHLAKRSSVFLQKIAAHSQTYFFHGIVSYFPPIDEDFVTKVVTLDQTSYGLLSQLISEPTWLKHIIINPNTPIGFLNQLAVDTVSVKSNVIAIYRKTPAVAVRLAERSDAWLNTILRDNQLDVVIWDALFVAPNVGARIIQACQHDAAQLVALAGRSITCLLSVLSEVVAEKPHLSSSIVAEVLRKISEDDVIYHAVLSNPVFGSVIIRLAVKSSAWLAHITCDFPEKIYQADFREAVMQQDTWKALGQAAVPNPHWFCVLHQIHPLDILMSQNSEELFKRYKIALPADVFISIRKSFVMLLNTEQWFQQEAKTEFMRRLNLDNVENGAQQVVALLGSTDSAKPRETILQCYMERQLQTVSGQDAVAQAVAYCNCIAEFEEALPTRSVEFKTWLVTRLINMLEEEKTKLEHLKNPTYSPEFHANAKSSQTSKTRIESVINTMTRTLTMLAVKLPQEHQTYKQYIKPG